MNRVKLLILSCFALLSCGEKKAESTKLDKLGWLLGYWEMQTPEGITTESWVRTNDSIFSGIGKFTDSAGKVLSSEEIRIVLRSDGLYYIPTVSNQNNGQPVMFREKSFADTMVVFENPAHDFPQRIGYIRISAAAARAYIEGMVGDSLQHIDFDYARK